MSPMSDSRRILSKIREKALATGASKVYVEDLKEEFVTHYIFPVIKANALYEGRYLLGTAIARPLIAKRQIEIANAENAIWVSHGATGKGNDQVRFELSYYALKPGIKVLAPWKDAEFLREFKGRPDLMKYAERHGIPVQATGGKPYSEDENLFHISHESGILEDPALEPAKDVYSRTVDPEDAPDAADPDHDRIQGRHPDPGAEPGRRHDRDEPAAVVHVSEPAGERTRHRHG